MFFYKISYRLKIFQRSLRPTAAYKHFINSLYYGIERYPLFLQSEKAKLNLFIDAGSVLRGSNLRCTLYKIHTFYLCLKIVTMKL